MRAIAAAFRALGTAQLSDSVLPGTSEPDPRAQAWKILSPSGRVLDLTDDFATAEYWLEHPRFGKVVNLYVRTN